MPEVKTFFKDPPRWDSKQYRDWVSTFPSCFSKGWFLPSNRGSLGLSDPHHEAEPGEKGMSTKPGDEHCVPLDRRTHSVMESPGHSRDEIWKEHEQGPHFVKELLWELWKRETGEYPGEAETWVKKWRGECSITRKM